MNDFIINQEKLLKYNFRSRMVLRSPWLNFISTARFQHLTKVVTLYTEMIIDAFPGKESVFPTLSAKSSQERQNMLPLSNLLEVIS